jgi:hypothetical protein
MKTPLSFLSLILLVAISSQGAVVVYRRSESAQYIGQGYNVRVSGTGFTVLDSQSLTGFNITAFNIRGQKLFTTSSFEDGLRSYSVTGPGGRAYAAFVGSAVTNKPTQFEDKIEFSIGANSVLAITPTNTVNLPRVVNTMARAVLVPTGEAGIVAQGHGVASYSKTETRLANSLAETPGDSLARYRASLVSRGYEDVTE